MELQRELAVYRKELPNLLQHAGKYVVIQGDRVADVFTSYTDALRDGYRRFGLRPFLVKQIRAMEPIHFITRTGVR
jgi:hypothetical protein